MGKIRVNELARELAVKSSQVLESLHSLGVTGPHSHSSALDDDIADRVRTHLRSTNQTANEFDRSPDLGNATAGGIPNGSGQFTLKPSEPPGPNLQPLTRSIAEIKASARKSLNLPPYEAPSGGGRIPPASHSDQVRMETTRLPAPTLIAGKERVPRHYIKILQILRPYATSAGAPEFNWQSSVFDDISNMGKSLIIEPLPVNERGSRIALHGSSYCCEAGVDRDREDALFVFRIQRARLPRLGTQKYEGQFELLTSRFAQGNLDPIKALLSPAIREALIQQELPPPRYVETEPSEQLAAILAHCPEEFRRAWGPGATPASLSSTAEFIEAFRQPWIKFRLERYARLSPRQESLVNETLKPTQLGNRERWALLAVLDLRMLDEFVKDNVTKSGSVYVLVHGLLRQLAALPISSSVRSRVWTAMLSGMDRTSFLRQLRESAASLNRIRGESATEAQFWEKSILRLLKTLGEKDKTLLELHSNCLQDALPLKHLVDWLERLEFRPEPVEAPGPTAATDAVVGPDQSEAGQPTPLAQLPEATPETAPPDAVIEIGKRTTLDEWVLARQVPDVLALEQSMSQITLRLSNLGKKLPSGSLVERLPQLVNLLNDLIADIPKWLESLPNPETLAADYKEAAEVYREAAVILGKEVDAIIMSTKLTPADLRQALSLGNSLEKLPGLPRWVWDLKDAAAIPAETENAKRGWIKRLIVPEIRERVTAFLEVFREAEEDKSPLLPFVPPPEGNGEPDPNTDIRNHVRTWLQDFSGLLAPLPLDVRTQFQKQLTSANEYQKLIYCAGVFKDVKDRLAPATCVELVQYLITFEDLEQLYFQGDLYRKAVEEIESFMGEDASQASFSLLKKRAQQSAIQQAPKRQVDGAAASVEVDHNWVDHPRKRAPLIYFPDSSRPFGSITVPLTLKTKHRRSWTFGLSVDVKTGHRDAWPANWDAISPRELDVKEFDWRNDLQSPEVGVYSIKVRIPIRRDQGRGAGLKFEVSLVDRQTNVRIGETQLFEWEVINEAPTAISQVWPQTTNPQQVEKNPIGPQRKSEEILRHIGAHGSFAIMAPRRFGKSTLVEYLRSRAQQQEFVVPKVPNCLSYLRSSGIDYEHFWNDISVELQEELGASITKPLVDGLPNETAFDHLRRAAKAKGKRGIAILVDEAQVFFPRRTGIGLGDLLKDRIERYWSRPDKPGLAPLVMGLVGLPSLRERAGANLLALFYTYDKDVLTEDELNNLILSGTEGQLHTTREARRRLEKSARNLYILKALVIRLAERAYLDERTWVNSDDVVAVERHLKRELQEGEAEDLAVYVKDALNDAETVNEWIPNASLALAIALASAKDAKVSSASLYEEAKSQLKSWCESLKVSTSIQQLSYDEDQFSEHLGILQERRVFVKNEFPSELLEAWLLGLKRDIDLNPSRWSETIVRAAIRRIRLPEPLEIVGGFEGGQARVWTCILDGEKCAVRKTKLETADDRQRFIEEKEILDLVKQRISKGEPGHEYIFAIKDVGLSSESQWEGLLVYHWIEGCDLSQKIGKLSGPFVAELGTKLARALRFLHSAEILHRDLRPGNIILSEQNYDPKIIDFGFARRITTGGRTPMYDKWAAPEVQRENPMWTTASDVYSLGATLRAVLDPAEANDSMAMLLEKCCHVTAGERPSAADLYDQFWDVAGELRVEFKKSDMWKRVNDMAVPDCKAYPRFKGVIHKFRHKFEALALGCSRDQFDRSREIADFLNQVLEALRGGLSLGAAKNELHGALATNEVDFLHSLRTFGSHGSKLNKQLVLGQFGNPTPEGIRTLTLNGTKQIAEYLSAASLFGIVESLL